MKYISIVSAVCIWVTLLSPSAEATTVFPIEITCPVCQETFIDNRIGSYSMFGEPSRDLRDSMFCVNVCTCPYCLYSAINYDFEEITADEKQQLKVFLADIKLDLRDEERKALLQSCEDSDRVPVEFLCNLLTRECYRLRKTDIDDDLAFHRFLYYRTWTNELSVLYRCDLIESLIKYLQADIKDKGEQLAMTYLLGEMYRQDGQFIKALASFESVKSHWKKLSGKQKDDYKLIFDFTIEQASNTNMRSLGALQIQQYLLNDDIDYDSITGKLAKAAILLLLERNDQESLEVLAKFFNDHDHDKFIERFIGDRKSSDMYQIMSIANPVSKEPKEDEVVSKAFLSKIFRGDIFRNYIVAKGDTLTSIAQGNETKVSRILEINPQITDPNMISIDSLIRLINTPVDWDERRLLHTLDDLLDEKHPVAIPYSIEWLKTVGKESIDDYDYIICRVLTRLERENSMWTLPAEKQVASELIYDCLSYLKGSRDGLVGQFPYEDSCFDSIALKCFAAKKDETIKEKVIARLSNKDGWAISSEAADYFESVCGQKDVAELKAIACAAGSDNPRDDLRIWARQRIEEIILNFQLKEVLGNLLE